MTKENALLPAVQKSQELLSKSTKLNQCARRTVENSKRIKQRVAELRLTRSTGRGEQHRD